MEWVQVNENHLKPLGGRGDRPWVLVGAEPGTLAFASRVPGAVNKEGLLHCSIDAAISVSNRLGVPFPNVEGQFTLPPGLHKFGDIFGSKLRDYQIDSVEFLANRSWAYLSLPMRCGKSLTSLATTVALASTKILILAPALVVPVWRNEVRKWLPNFILMQLLGRAAEEAKLDCFKCATKGIIQADGFSYSCIVCRGKGRVKINREDMNVFFQEASEDKPIVVVASYDILMPQTEHDAFGKKKVNLSLPGWMGAVSEMNFDVAILDEVHKLRSWEKDKDKVYSRRLSTKKAISKIQRVYGLSGTPIYGFVRDLWGQLDVLSNGLYSDPPYPFHVEYCAGGPTGYNGAWEAKGSGPYEDELKNRLAVWMYRRNRRDLNLGDTGIIRQVFEIDPPDPIPKSLLNTTDMSASLRAGLPIKIEALMENTLAELVGGDRLVVWTFHRASAERVAIAYRKAIESGDHSKALRQANTQVWVAHGEQSAEVREAQAKQFRNHAGAGVFIGTVKGLEGGISLAGAVSEHIIEACWDPATILQIEARPHEVGVSGLIAVYYKIVGSVDGTMIEVLLEKMSTMENITNDIDAAAFITAIGERELIEDVMARLTAHIKVPKDYVPEEDTHLEMEDYSPPSIENFD